MIIDEKKLHQKRSEKIMKREVTLEKKKKKGVKRQLKEVTIEKKKNEKMTRKSYIRKGEKK